MDAGTTELRRYVDETRGSWNRIAAWWDGTVGEGANAVVRPAVERLLDLRPEERVLEVACGNGALARRLAELGARVLASDFSAEFLRIAEERTGARPELAGRIAYRLVDATDPAQLGALGDAGAFDAAVCVMGLMDMPTIEPLLGALRRLLAPDGRFVFTVVHPCFNTNGVKKVVEEEIVDGEVVERHAVLVSRYLSLAPERAVGIVGQPTSYHQFNRPLGALFGSVFRAGFVLDGLEEVAAPAPADASRIRRLFSWARFQEIPPFLVARARLSAPVPEAGGGAMAWTTISSRVVLDHPRLTVLEDEVLLPDGSTTTYLRWAPVGTCAVTVICRDGDGRVLLEREYSYPPDRWLLQFPGGGSLPGEEPAVAANRELMEEVGLRAERLTPLGSYLINNRRSDGRMLVYLAEGLTAASLPADPEERIEYAWVTEAEVDRLIATDGIENHSLLCAWRLYRAKIGRRS